MAKHPLNRGSTSGNREAQSGSGMQELTHSSGSQQQMNRDSQSGSSSDMIDTQLPGQHSRADIPGSLCDRVDIPGVISHCIDVTLLNPPSGPDTASSQHSDPVSTETGSDGHLVTIPPPDSHPVWEGVLDPAVLEKLGSHGKK
jgi:hypothetical protein